MRPITIALAATAAALAALPATALAKKNQVSIFQSDGLLRNGSPEVRAKTLDELNGLGVDVVKSILSWRNVAPAGKRKPSGFDGRNPASYSAESWAPFDDLVRQAQARGMRVMFALGGRAPQWASSGTKRYPGTKRPNAREFRDFVHAVGTRYSGSYVIGGGGSTPSPSPAPDPDPDLPIPIGSAQSSSTASASQSGSTLPRVSLWAVWNEPNLGNWLAPQRRKGVPFAPHHYRKLVNAANNGLSSSGHGRDQLLIGELVPYGANKNRMRPIHFLREMACVNGRYRPFRGKAARKRGCRKFKRLPGTGLSIHPYTPAGGPNVRMRHRDDAPIGYLRRVARALDRLYRKKRIQRRKMPIWNTEFGFQTDPPDIFQTPIKKVPGFMGKSEWLSWRNRRVASHAQYLLRDEELSGSGVARYSGWQSGIRFANGRAKPGVYKAYRLPFYVRPRGGRRVEAWGGIRNQGRGVQVTIQSRLPKKKWRNVQRARTGAQGYFRKRFKISRPKKRQYRFKAAGNTSVQLRARR